MSPPASYEARKAAGLCVTCGTNPARKGRVCCQPCADRARNTVNRWRRERKAAGLCEKCGRPRVNRTHCQHHADEAARYQLARYHARQARAPAA